MSEVGVDAAAEAESDEARRILREVFGYAAFRGQQEAIVRPRAGGRRCAWC